MGMWRSMMISFALQSVAITACVIVSILTVDKLKAISLPPPMPAIPRAPKAIAIVASHRGASSGMSSLRVQRAQPFVAPRGIPASLPEESMAEAPMITGAVTGTSSGTDGGIPGALQGVAITPPPPPPPTPTPRRQAESRPAIKLGGNVMEARIVKRVMPIYPVLARQARISGTVRLQGTISRTGQVINLLLVSGHPLLAAAALDAVRQWVYRPTLLNGEAVEVIAPIEVHFTLSQ